MEMKDIIRTQREKLKLTYEEIGNYVGVGKSTVKKWESGYIANMRRDKIQKLAEVLQVTPGYLMGWKNELNSVSSVIPFDPNSIIMLPVYGKIAAGIPITANQEYSERFPMDTRFFNINGYSIEDFFFLRVQGDSMEPGIMNGDLVLVRKQPTLESNEVGVVLYNGEDATVKRVTAIGDKMVLNSDNKAYPPQIYNATECQILGRVLQRVGEVK